MKNLLAVFLSTLLFFAFEVSAASADLAFELQAVSTILALDEPEAPAIQPTAKEVTLNSAPSNSQAVAGINSSNSQTSLTYSVQPAIATPHKNAAGYRQAFAPLEVGWRY